MSHRDDIKAADLYDWFHRFGMEGALAIIRIRFTQGYEERVKFAEAIVPEGYRVVRVGEARWHQV